MRREHFYLRYSLSKQLLIPLVSSFIFVVLLITTLVYYGMSSSLEQSINKRLLVTAETIKTQLETLFEQHALNTSAWAKLEVMDDIITDDVDGRINRSLMELKSSYHLKGDIFVFNPNHQLVAATNDQLLSQLEAIVPPSQWFDTTNVNVRFLIKRKNPYSNQNAVIFTQPIIATFDPQKMIGSLIVTHPWSDIERIVLPAQGHGLLLNSKGIPLINNVPDVTNTHKFSADSFNGSINLVLGNRNYLAGTTTIEHVLNVPLNWIVVTLDHRDDALAPVRELGLNIAFVSFILIILTVGFVLFITQRVMQPVKTVTQTVLDIAQSSDLSKRVIISSRNEIGILADSFNRMTEKLASTMAEKDLYSQRLALLNKTLEQQVLERTEAYRAANDELQTAIEQLQQAQTQLIQSEKMASLGQLVAGIAHEINNPLGSINANIPVLADYTQDLFGLIDQLTEEYGLKNELEKIDYEFLTDDTPKLLSSMKNASLRMREIVLSLRNFSRLDEAEVQDILIEEAIDTTLSLLAHRLKSHITVTKNYQLNQRVSCYAGLINQVLMNVLVNAEQAIDGQGVITIETAKDREFALIIIRDSGKGMNQETLDKIFDPFYTTKPVGEGTGMGLSISYGIIDKHHGSISVDSKVDQGTTFTIRLPIRFIQLKD